MFGKILRAFIVLYDEKQDTNIGRTRLQGLIILRGGLVSHIISRR